MIPETHFYLPKYYSDKAIAAFFIAIAACNILFFNKTLPIQWMLTATIEAVCFFYFTNTLSRRWIRYSEKRFQKKLFTTTLVLRISWVLIAYAFYSWMNGEPFEFAAADSHFYDEASSDFLQMMREGNFSGIFTIPSIDISDTGYPLWLAIIKFIFGTSVLPPRLIHAVFSAWTAVLLYKLSSRNFGEATGRLTGIMCMLLPNFFFYAGIHLKETLMIFLVVSFAYNADILLRSIKFTWQNIAITIAIALILFLFRTVLGVVALFSLFTALILSKGQSLKKWNKRIAIASWIGILIAVLISGKVISEIEAVYNNRVANQQIGMQSRATQEGGNAFAKYGSAAVFAPFIVVLPFPSFTNANQEQQNQQMFSGGYFTRNIYSFFVLIALVLLVKWKEWREHLLIITFFSTYLVIIAMSNFAVAERFHLPAVPFLLCLAAYGMTHIKRKEKKWFLPYVVFIVLAVIAWNYIKIAGRS
jgi:4-amino-4-deoxy-L-arabinose transferase-like glycosyltransferase